MKVITTHLSPTSNKPFAREALKIILSSDKNRSEILKELTQILTETTGLSTISLFSSGRSALYYSLKALGVKMGDEVVLQAFTCSVVPDAILENYGIPIFADIDPASLTISPQSLKSCISPRTKAVIFQHTFGSNYHLEEVSKICQKVGVLLIEDKAHIIDNSQLMGKLAIFSFGRTKWASSVFGGAIGTNDLEFSQHISMLIRNLNLPSYPWIFYQLLQPAIAEYLVKPSLGLLGLGEMLLFMLSHLGIMSKEVTQDEKNGKLSNIITHSYHPALARLLLFQLKNQHYLSATRTTSVQLYLRRLTPGNLIPGFRSLKPYLYFPIVVDDPQSVYECAKSKGVYLGNWYYPSVSPPGTNNSSVRYRPFSCPHSEKISQHIVNLPTLITASQAEKVVEVINQCRT